MPTTLTDAVNTLVTNTTTLQSTVTGRITDMDGRIATAEVAKVAAEAAKAGAEVAKSAADTAKTDAETAQTLAENAKLAAETAQGIAATAKTDALTAKNDSDTAKTNAVAAQVASESAKNSAQDWATKTTGAVSVGEYSAKYHATQASTDAATATTKASSATTSESNALSSKNSASASATAASASETNAASSESAAATSKSNASISESNALSSKNSASTSAATATTKATAAAGSATSASGSATTATTKASEASTSATSASGSATTATTKASEASASATSASGSASTATTKAGEASTSATSASGSATTATTKASEASASATSASGSATAATTKATEASASASAALSSKNAAAASASTAASTLASKADTTYVDSEIASINVNNITGNLNVTSNANTPTLRLSSGSSYTADYGPSIEFQNGVNELLAGVKGAFEHYNNGNYGVLILSTRTSDVLGIEEKMRITSAGNVGIDTTSPNAKLTVLGGHNTARIQLRRDDAIDSQKSCLTLWASEPGVTHDGCGIGGNVNVSGHYYGVHNAVQAGSYARFYEGTTSFGSMSAGSTNGGIECMRIDGSGRVTMPYQPAFHAYGLGNDINTNNTVIKFASVTSPKGFDTGGNYSTSTGRFTAPVSGTYQFSWTTIANSTNDVFRTFFNVNGSMQGDVHLRQDNGATGDEYGTNGMFTITWKLSAGDYVNITAFTDNSASTWYGGTGNPNNDYYRFMGHLIG